MNGLTGAHGESRALNDSLSADTTARVGPNAVLQLAQSLRALTDEGTLRAVFLAAGQEALLDHPPSDMVPEAIPASLFAALYTRLPRPLADRVAQDAGRRTADYLLVNRIPGFAQRILRALPRRWAAPVLLKAIHRNAWTFAGSGDCRVETRSPLVVEIANNPMPMPDCRWQQAVFMRLFHVLVSPAVVIKHSHCCFNGDSRCRFQISI